MSEGHHIIPIKVYTGTVIALLVLTVITVATARLIDLGSFNIILAMFIACIKATLVCLFFMGLKYDRKLNVVVFASSLLFLVFFFMLTFMDILTRDEIDPVRDRLIDQQYKEYQ